jgi:hypothetical protein
MMVVTQTKLEYDECTMCTMCTNHMRNTPEQVLWKLESDHPQRNFVVTLCDACMLEVFHSVMRQKGLGSDGGN